MCNFPLQQAADIERLSEWVQDLGERVVEVVGMGQNVAVRGGDESEMGFDYLDDVFG